MDWKKRGNEPLEESPERKEKEKKGLENEINRLEESLREK